jgi:hypothetical protein
MQRITRRALLPLVVASLVGVTVEPAQANTPAQPDYNLLAAEYERGYKAGQGNGYADGHWDGRQSRKHDIARINTESAIVTGALFDFMGYLTTHEKSIVVGSGETVYALLDAYTAWAALRGLDDHSADVEHWSKRLHAREPLPDYLPIKLIERNTVPIMDADGRLDAVLVKSTEQADRD